MGDIIKMLEEATGGSRELDAEICRIAYWESDGYFSDQDDHGEWFIYSYRFGGTAIPKEPLPHYTTSLDAALTLVPEGWTSKQIFITGAGSKARLKRPSPYALVAPMESYERDRLVATPALALCVAALKAREAS